MAVTVHPSIEAQQDTISSASNKDLTISISIVGNQDLMPLAGQSVCVTLLRCWPLVLLPLPARHMRATVPDAKA